MRGLLENKILICAILGWFIAQALKVVFVLIQEKKFDMRRFVGSGGMPSSHSSFVLALTTAVAFEEGLSSALFAVCVVFSFIVMYDAAGVRRAAGKQAEILNSIIENFWQDNPKVTGERLKELLGHTPKQVFVGAILGILISVIMYNL